MLAGLSGGASCRLAGRADELGAVRELVTEVRAGSSRLLVVLGEPGIGKSRLIRAALGEPAAARCTTWWGTCVEFGSGVVPFAPVLSAYHSWVDDLDDRLARPDSAARLDRLLRGRAGALGGDGPVAALVGAFDDLLRELARSRPTLLVLDDYQWADASTHDLVRYLLTDPNRRLGVIVIGRSEDREGHPWHARLAQLQHVDGCRDLLLGPLTPAQTADQVAALLHHPSEEVAARIHQRSRGNPYFTELLADDLDPAGGQLPDQVPRRLREAVLAPWHCLPDGARQLARILAVGGRPVPSTVLASVLATVVPAVEFQAAVRATMLAGVVVGQPQQTLWLRHPLLAEVLGVQADGLDEQAVHSAYAAALAATTSTVVAAADVARHHEAAGEFQQAYRWALTAAEEAAALQAFPERAWALTLASRCQVHLTVGPGGRVDAGSRIDLLRQAADAALAADELDQALGLLDEAAALVDPVVQPLLASALLQRRAPAAWAAHPHPEVAAQLDRAIAWAAGSPDSAEYACGLAMRVALEVVAGRPGPTDLADDGVTWAPGLGSARTALAAARRSGDLTALARATCAVAFAERAVDPGSSLDRLTTALRLATAAEDRATIATASGLRARQLLFLSPDDIQVAAAEDAASTLLGLGEPQQSRAVAADVAWSLLYQGSWARAETLIRPALAVGGRSHGTIGALFVATLLAARRGRPSTRADRWQLLCTVAESGYELYPLPEALAEHLLACDQPGAAMQVLLDRHRRPRPTAAVGHRYLALAAAAAAAAHEHARDVRDRSADGMLAALAEIEDRAAGTSADPRAVLDRRHEPAWRARYAAERCRATGRQHEEQAWHQLREAASDSGLPWEQAYAGWRLAQTLVRSQRPRREVAAAVRPAYDVARRLGALGLRTALEGMAVAAHVSLAEPTAAQGTAGTVLTSREEQVLAQIAAGRTNHEIAAALVISEKTVSVHVSSILRKTQSANRVEAAGWARRLGRFADRSEV